MMTKGELCESLGASTGDVDGWLSQGMPSHNGEFKPAEVRDWLLRNGMVETQIANTQAELAIQLKRSERVIASYVARGMPKLPEGGYDVAACKAWIAQNVQPKPQHTIQLPIITEADLSEVAFRFGRSILAENDVLQIALAPHGRQAARALAIDMLAFLIEVLSDVEQIDADQIYELLGVTDQEAADYPRIVEELGQRLGVEE